MVIIVINYMSKEKITFICVLRSGKEYNQDHVKNLFDMVSNNYSFDYDFIALSDVEINFCKCVPLTKNWKGWWSKLELFLHDFGKTVYFDLDIEIKSSIDWMADIEPDDEIYGYQCPIYPKLLNSSIMVWRNSKDYILTDYSSKVNVFWKTWPHRYGDQGWIQKKMNKKIRFLPPERIERYGVDGPKETSSIIVYGGKTRPWNK